MSLPLFGAALVTGASSGIGKATAHALAGAGYLTVATARDPRTLGDLEAAGCRVLALDVTDDSWCCRPCGGTVTDGSST